MTKTKERLDKIQARYKKNYDARLRKQSEVINKDENVYLRFERKNTKGHLHKRAPVSECPYKATKTYYNTIAIEKTDRSVENVSRSQVVPAPKPIT